MNPNHEPEVELPHRLADAVRVIVEAPLDDAAIERVQQRARQHAVGQIRPSSARRFAGSRRRAILAGAGLACSVLVAAFLVVMLKGDAWAQVAKSVESKPWVHWTIQIPAGAGEAEVVTEEIRRNSPEIWISLPKKVGASKFGQNSFYVDFGRQEVYRYEPSERTVYRESTSGHDEAFFQQFDSMLRLILQQGNQLELPESPVQLIGQSHAEKRDGDRHWIEFTFRFRDTRLTPASYQTLVRVDPETRLPIDMRTTQGAVRDDLAVARVFVFDYPETGPADIYALGIPRTATVVDWRRPAGARELRVAHIEAGQKRIEPYSAIVLHSDRKAEFKDIFTAARVSFDGQMWRYEEADFNQLLNLRQQLWSRQIKIPEGTDPALWWKDQVSGMNFTPSREAGELSGHSFFPDRVGYYVLGDPSGLGAQITINQHPAIGPAGTILTTVRTKVGYNAHWFDPRHDYLSMRTEMLTNDSVWKYQATIIDKLDKSPSGRWFATEARCGQVKETGEDPPDDRNIAPVTTAVYRYFVEFDKPSP